MAKNASYYFKSKMDTHTTGFINYCLLEWLNLGVVFLNFWLINRFLKGRFWNYGWKALEYYIQDEQTRFKMENPMCSAFPTMVSSHDLRIPFYFIKYFIFG